MRYASHTRIHVRCGCGRRRVGWRQPVRATFVREDGLGIVRETCVGASTRANIWTATAAELSGHRFATFLESVESAPCGSEGGELFVAERAMYLGAAFAAGHVTLGTPWPGMIVAPPPQ